MTYNILGVTPGHNGSTCLLSDGEIVYFLEEERLSRQKYDSNPFRGMIDVLTNWSVDELVISGTNLHENIPCLTWTQKDPFTTLALKYNSDIKTFYYGDQHHLTHASCAFYNSGFSDALCIVVDGMGSWIEIDNHFESESIYYASYPDNFDVIYKSFSTKNKDVYVNQNNLRIDESVSICKMYEAITEYLGFHLLESGKTMGLSSYGKESGDIPSLLYDDRGDRNFFTERYPGGCTFNYSKILYLDEPSSDWHRDPTKVTDKLKNLAWKVQQTTQKMVGDLIESHLDKVNTNNVCLSGGYMLNCVSNYYLKKRFPHINFYVEPISSDAGTSIGAAKLRWHSISNDMTIRKQKSIYYGPLYDNTYTESVLDLYKDKFCSKKVSYTDVAKIIADRNIVTIFQGRSEAGPRALGNRSILYDPTDPNGKDFVNRVKGREWFRPFAGTVLKEDVHEWFDMAGLDESPFMMYAVDVKYNKKDKIKSIVHVDDTCRIQTVTEQQNKHYYNLIKEFDKITGVPILFNTSFNLAGDPLVETLEDAFNTLLKSDIIYLYLPDQSILLEKK